MAQMSMQVCMYLQYLSMCLLLLLLFFCLFVCLFVVVFVFVFYCPFFIQLWISLSLVTMVQISTNPSHHLTLIGQMYAYVACITIASLRSVSVYRWSYQPSLFNSDKMI